MKKRNILFSICFMFLLIFSLAGCGSKDTEKDNDTISTQNMNLICEETVSPNKEYVTVDEDIVNFTVEIYQNKNNKILVNSKSNSEFFKPLQYELEYDKEITKSDIDIEWTTAMGNPNPTKDDQLVIAYVSISEDGKVFSKRKISFANKAIEIIEDTLNKK